MALKGRALLLSQRLPSNEGSPGRWSFRLRSGLLYWNGLCVGSVKSRNEDERSGSTVTRPVNNCALLTWEFPKEKQKHSYDKKLQSFAHFIRGKTRWYRCAFLWFDHADVEKHTSTNEDEHTVNGGILYVACRWWKNCVTLGCVKWWRHRLSMRWSWGIMYTLTFYPNTTELNMISQTSFHGWIWVNRSLEGF